MTLTGYVCCIVGDHQYAVHARDVRNVARAERLRRAGRDEGVGTIRHAGADVPVFSVARMMGLPEDLDAADRHVLVTRGIGRDVGLLVDRVVRTPLGDDARVLPLPSAIGETALRRFQGLLRYQDWAYLVISPASIDPRGGVSASRSRVRSRARSRNGAAPDLVAVFSSPSLPPCPADRYALQARHVEALAQSLPSVPVPGAAPYVRALAWWRDEVAPLVAFGGAPHANGARQRLVLARCEVAGEDTCVAFAVTGDVALHRATRADHTVPFDSRRHGFVRGVFEIGGERVALLDLPSLLVPGVQASPAALREDVPVLI